MANRPSLWQNWHWFDRCLDIYKKKIMAKFQEVKMLSVESGKSGPLDRENMRAWLRQNGNTLLDKKRKYQVMVLNTLKIMD